VDDPRDDRLIDYRNVPDAELLAGRGIFVAEGRLVVRRLIAGSRFAVRSVMVTDAARAALEEVLSARGELPVYVVPQALTTTIAGFDIHRGCLAIGERPEPAGWEAVASAAANTGAASGAATLVVLERIANADNVGGIFRNAAAFGAGAVLLDPATTDPLYRKAIRTSMGAALHVPFGRAHAWPEALHRLRARGFALIAMTPSPSAAALRDVTGAIGSTPAALVLGHEGEGLSQAAIEACTHQARIPIATGVDSLNVASAAAIALYELSHRTWSA
jgi:tRNA G18 (ribose-2'-O)-methylase SpoU